MTKTTFTQRFASLSLAMLFVVTSVGCQSSGGSRWAWWNPLSSSSEDATLVARTAPALPSDSATPKIEGIAAPATTLAAAAPAVKTTNPALPTIVASSPAPAFQSSPTAEATKIASTPQIPSKPATPAVKAPGYPLAAIPAMANTTQQSAAGGPYDPNGYKETATTVATTTANPMGDRYGNLGNRYDSAPAQETPAFNYQPEVAQTSPAKPYAPPAAAAPTNSVVGNRYNSYAAASGNRYQTPEATNAYTPQSASNLAASNPAMTSPATQSVDRYAASTPSYAAAPAVTPPASDSARYPATVDNASAGIASKPAQVAPSNTPSTGTVVASNNNPLGSEVRLVSSPGQYRPGGTSTYPSSMNIATKPDAASGTPATPSYPSSGSRYK